MPFTRTPETQVADVFARLPPSFVQIKTASKKSRQRVVSSLFRTATLAVMTPTPAVEQWNVIGSATVVPSSPSAANLAVVLERVNNLVQEAEEDEAVPPSEHALAEARRLLRDSFPLVRSTFPRASAASDGRGWIHLYWRTVDRMVQLTVPADMGRPPFIYHSSGNEYDVEKPITPERLALWIDWFANA